MVKHYLQLTIVGVPDDVYMVFHNASDLKRYCDEHIAFNKEILASNMIITDTDPRRV